MKRLLRRLLWWLPLLVVALVAGAWLLLNAWLEGAGGRAALEAALTERLGVPVHLEGDFDVMLLPSIGVDGTELTIGRPGADTEIVRARRYAVTLALRPLLDRRMVVEAFALSGGKFYLERWPGPDRGSAGATDHSPELAGPLMLPEIRSLRVEGFDLIDGEGSVLRVLAFEIRDFVPGSPAPFELGLQGWGRFAGDLRWSRDGLGFALTAEWSGRLDGTVAMEVGVRLDQGAGSVAGRWQPPASLGQAGQAVQVEFDYAQQPGGIRLDRLVLRAGAQQLSGHGCLVENDAAALNLELEAETIDLDAIPDLSPLSELLGTSAPQAAGAEDSEGRRDEAAAAADRETDFDLNVRLVAAELRSQGAVAYDAWLNAGAAPDCGSLGRASPGSESRGRTGADRGAARQDR